MKYLSKNVWFPPKFECMLILIFQVNKHKIAHRTKTTACTTYWAMDIKGELWNKHTIWTQTFSYISFFLAFHPDRPDILFLFPFIPRQPLLWESFVESDVADRNLFWLCGLYSLVRKHLNTHTNISFFSQFIPRPILLWEEQVFIWMELRTGTNLLCEMLFWLAALLLACSSFSFNV